MIVDIAKSLTTSIALTGFSVLSPFANPITPIVKEAPVVFPQMYSGEIADTLVSKYYQFEDNTYIQKKMSKIEKEAHRLFGSMRPATPEELKSVQDYISSISKKTGVNFWDLC